MSTFHNLLSDSVSMYLEASKIQQLFQMRLGDTGEQIFREWAVKEDARSDVYLEMVDSHVLPFDRRQVGEALKGFYGLHTLKQRRCIGEVRLSLS